MIKISTKKYIYFNFLLKIAKKKKKFRKNVKIELYVEKIQQIQATNIVRKGDFANFE